MYLYIHICIYIYVYIYAYIYMYTHRIYLYTYIYEFMYIHIYIDIYIYMYMYIYYIYIHIYIYTYINIYIYMCTYIHYYFIQICHGSMIWTFTGVHIHSTTESNKFSDMSISPKSISLFLQKNLARERKVTRVKHTMIQSSNSWNTHCNTLQHAATHRHSYPTYNDVTWILEKNVCVNPFSHWPQQVHFVGGKNRVAISDMPPPF